MAFRRSFRRRPKRVVWLPNTTENNSTFITGSVTVPAAAITPSTTIHALTVDYPAEAIQAAGPQPPSVADYVQSGFRIERIVGKFFAGMQQGVGAAQATYPQGAVLALGLIVLRVDELNGAPLRALTPNEYSPLVDDNERDPFFFRRSWLLGNGFAVPAPVIPWAYAPRTTMEFGSALDGPHIDTMTRRVVRTEERVFAIVSAMNPGDAADLAGTINYVFDYRMLVTPRVMSNRNNASR